MIAATTLAEVQFRDTDISSKTESFTCEMFSILAWDIANENT